MQTGKILSGISQKINERIIIIVILTVMIILFPIVATHAGDQEEYIFSKTEDSIYHTLLEHGYSEAGVCGILGNISVENPKFEPDLYANRQSTYGLFQWSDTGKRKSNLTKWCNNRLLYPNRVEGQLAYAIYELEGGDAQASRVNQYLMEATDPKMAAMEFAVGFERCIGETNNSDADGIYSGIIYPERYGCTYQALTLRMDNASKYYEGYKGVAGSDRAIVLDIDGTPTAGTVAEREKKMEDELLKQIPVKQVSNKGILWMYRILSLSIGYLFGCVSGAKLIIRNIREKERLDFEHKLPSFFSVLKYCGIKETVLAALIDILKFLLALLTVYFITTGALGSEQILITGLGVILGNDFPFWHRFRGGMGIMVTIVFLCIYMPIWGYECILLGLLVAAIFKSFPFGALSITVFAVPYGFICKGTEAGIFITIVMMILMIRHYKFLKKFISRDILHNHYRRRRRTHRVQMG